VRAVAALGASLGISTTAESVETAEQMGRIREEGCTEAQGYLFSRPVPASEVERLIVASLATGQRDHDAPAAAA
jgi:EAL domain-containing protein (putative c-di-GMP-specific phosphodiesterase class I)